MIHEMLYEDILTLINNKYFTLVKHLFLNFAVKVGFHENSSIILLASADD